MALPPLYGGQILDLLVRDPLTYARHAILRGNRADDPDFVTATPDRPPVLLIHGFMGTRGALFVLEQRLRADGFPVFSINLGTLNIQDIRKSAFEIHLAIEKIKKSTDGKVSKIDVVGHSMGGLIALYYIKFMGGDAHVRKLVTLGSPYRGTWISLVGVAVLGVLSPSTWQMIPGSAFLRMLNAMPIPPAVEWASVYATYDALCPPATARVSPGTNFELPIAHAGLVLSADVYRIVKRVLRREHEPTTRTQTFVMVDGKWTKAGARPAESKADRERRRADRRRNQERRSGDAHTVAESGRLEIRAAKTARAARRARRKK